jgi:RND superfamily putative drug exporter
MTVVLALLGMFIIPTTIFRALAAGAIFVTLVSIISSMTLLPAILAKLGDRINWPRLSKRARLDTPYDVPGGVLGQDLAHRDAAPVVFLIGSVLILGYLGSFYFQLNKGSLDEHQPAAGCPGEGGVHHAGARVRGGLTDPAEIVITGDVNSAEAQAGIATLQRRDRPEPVVLFGDTGRHGRGRIGGRRCRVLQGETQNDASFGAIEQLRDEAVPAAFGSVAGVEVFVGGNSAIFLDFLHVTDSYQWIVLAFVLGLSFLLLMVVFRR